MPNNIHIYMYFFLRNPRVDILLLKNLYSEHTSLSSSPISRHHDNLFEALIVCYFFYSYPLILHLPWVLTEQLELFTLSESDYLTQNHICHIFGWEPTRWSTVFPLLPVQSDLVPVLSYSLKQSRESSLSPLSSPYSSVMRFLQIVSSLSGKIFLLFHCLINSMASVITPQKSFPMAHNLWALYLSFDSLSKL